MSDSLARLPLHDRHAERGARFAPFAGFEMPMRYGSIVAEHDAVRRHVGLFDVSHMGEIELRGPNAGELVDWIVTNDCSRLGDGDALYTVMCHPHGGIVDDLLVYRLAEDHWLCCVNAANRDKDFAHFEQAVAGRCDLRHTSDEWVQLALQGPSAEALLSPLVDLDLSQLRSFQARWGTVAGQRVLVSRTGYTGEDGFELYYATTDALPVFDALAERGDAHGLTPVGLAARDTLRLEARLMLYGHDITDDTSPLEAGLGWTVKLAKNDFIGRDALLRQQAEGLNRRLRGLVLEGTGGVLRAECDILLGDQVIGRTTSGGPSPTLGGSLALGYLDEAYADAKRVDVDVRGRRLTCTVTRKPFYKRSGG
jgi:aminomethyltransferase